ncbi:MAG TPA: hypothetical protein VH170_09280 [Chthoniobacterales bacterium]|nr:hypothetical protein [Chthoniobacterales bacterium]
MQRSSTNSLLSRCVGEEKLLREVLTLTFAEDYVLDGKGETIFRRRCFRPLLERITRKAIKRGIINDDAPQRCIDSHMHCFNALSSLLARHSCFYSTRLSPGD